MPWFYLFLFPPSYSSYKSALLAHVSLSCNNIESKHISSCAERTWTSSAWILHKHLYVRSLIFELWSHLWFWARVKIKQSVSNGNFCYWQDSRVNLFLLFITKYKPIQQNYRCCPSSHKDISKWTKRAFISAGSKLEEKNRELDQNKEEGLICCWNIQNISSSGGDVNILVGLCGSNRNYNNSSSMGNKTKQTNKNYWARMKEYMKSNYFKEWEQTMNLLIKLLPGGRLDQSYYTIIVFLAR